MLYKLFCRCIGLGKRTDHKTEKSKQGGYFPHVIQTQQVKFIALSNMNTYAIVGRLTNQRVNYYFTLLFFRDVSFVDMTHSENLNCL